MGASYGSWERVISPLRGLIQCQSTFPLTHYVQS
jgi:hypothetical protein